MLSPGGGKGCGLHIPVRFWAPLESRHGVCGVARSRRVSFRADDYGCTIRAQRNEGLEHCGAATWIMDDLGELFSLTGRASEQAVDHRCPVLQFLPADRWIPPPLLRIAFGEPNISSRRNRGSDASYLSRPNGLMLAHFVDGSVAPSRRLRAAVETPGAPAS